MRAVVLLVPLVACTPEVLPGSYFCGPEMSCPETQKCNEADHKCVLPGLVQPWQCEPDPTETEPDDSFDTAFSIITPECIGLPQVIDNCMPLTDTADWVRFQPPANCGALEIDVRITFPLAFQRLRVDLVDGTTGETLATDGDCMFEGENGNDIRCLRAPVSAGQPYGVAVSPTGEGDCDGDCAFNSYTLRIQLSPPD